MINYYLTKKVKISSDGRNYVPKVYVERKLKDSDEKQLRWVGLGYYPSFELALKGLVGSYVDVLLNNGENEIATVKQALKLLVELKKDIIVKVLEEKEEIEPEEEEETNEKTKKKRNKKSSK